MKDVIIPKSAIIRMILAIAKQIFFQIGCANENSILIENTTAKSPNTKAAEINAVFHKSVNKLQFTSQN